MGALRYNQGKPQLSFVLGFRKGLGALARVFEQGAIKYERDNWKKGGKPDAEYIDSALRHLAALGDGEVYDPDTGCMHAAHVAWNVLALIELNTHGNGINTVDLPDLDPGFDQAAFLEKYAEVPIEPKDNVDRWLQERNIAAGVRARNTVDL